MVFKSNDAKSNAGIFVRIADDILDQAGNPGAAFDRDAKGKISKPSMKRAMASADREEGAWFAVHRGYEVQIMDRGDKFHRTGASTRWPRRPASFDKAAGDWRTMIITLAGKRILIDVAPTDVAGSRVGGTIGAQVGRGRPGCAAVVELDLDTFAIGDISNLVAYSD